MQDYPRFHLALPISDIEKARQFYVGVLGCRVGREAENWIDFDFFGHQLSLHVKPEDVQEAKKNEVDGDDVPVRHFGFVAKWQDWHELAEKIKNNGIKFIIEPHIRFKGQVGEQATMFFTDYDGNAIEIKAFKDITKLFAA